MALPTQLRRRISDAQLIGMEFRYTNPEAVPGLNRGVPDPSAHPEIIGYYDETPPGGRRNNPGYPFIWCCHCGKPTHWDGRVLRDTAGETYIIGARVCGKEHYGDRYQDAERQFRERRERRAALIRWRNVLPLLPEYREELNQMLAWPGLGLVERKKAEIQRASPSGFEKILRHIETRAEMVAHWDYRDHDAEAERDRRFGEAVAAFNRLPSHIRRERRDQGLIPQEDNDQIWRRGSKPLGYLMGGDFLLEAADIRKHALDLRDAIDAITTIENAGTDSTELRVLTGHLRNLKDRIDGFWSADHNLGFVDLFFGVENLDRLAKWSEQYRQFTYTRDGQNLVVDDASRGRSVITPLVVSDAPRCDAVSASQHLDADFSQPCAEAA